MFITSDLPDQLHLGVTDTYTETDVALSFGQAYDWYFCPSEKYIADFTWSSKHMHFEVFPQYGKKICDRFKLVLGVEVQSSAKSESIDVENLSESKTAVVNDQRPCADRTDCSFFCPPSSRICYYQYTDFEVLIKHLNHNSTSSNNYGSTFYWS
ncbi:hypothetical protein Ccrd_006473 [Cynara cardunculus var. scolymus]|uniref:Uncharacterized protein n=1 Tax=Cynara cardunculus var. scolymus TaxID=59895 RepID=A0A103XIN8_CYNCS|nr:hypothetical protein Ccrd_006473 [Cynara cardunculus var. scolymus]